jgi:alkylation response protein AidB-like acyl-CoA dehydrogenase
MAQAKSGYVTKEVQVRWLKRLNERGWVAPDWPAEYGDSDFTPTQKYIFEMEISLSGAPSPSNMGLKMCAPVIIAFETPEQKAQHLPKILNTDVWWC